MYVVILSGFEGEYFRGFLVEARTVLDGSPVGAFNTNNSKDQATSSCTPAEVNGQINDDGKLLL